jgi:RecA-family ATPase
MNGTSPAEFPEPAPIPLSKTIVDGDPNRCAHCNRLQEEHHHVDTRAGPEYFCPDEAGELLWLAALRKEQELADILANISKPIGTTSTSPPPAEPPPHTEIPPSADGEPDHDAQAPAPPAPFTLVCPPAWRDVPLPPMRWLATNRIPAGDVTILSGDGGGGKTTVALQLAVSVERDLGDWLGTTCETGPVMFFSGEEPETEMRRRLHRVARSRNLEAAELERLHFHFADPDACLLGISRPNGPMVPTPLFESLCAAALDIRPALIVVDSIAATFGGNQNDRVHARSFVGMFRRLAREADCAILLLDHPSLSGITSGTGRGGNMDWQNATRARLHLETVNDSDDGTERVLEVKKTNYGPCGEKVKLRWDDGCFVPTGTPSASTQAATFGTAELTYLACLDRLTEQGREVREHKGRNYAPATFAEMPEANGITARGFKAAQDRLFSAGMIHVVTDGPPSKPTHRIARKMAAEQVREAAE